MSNFEMNKKYLAAGACVLVAILIGAFFLVKRPVSSYSGATLITDVGTIQIAFVQGEATTTLDHFMDLVQAGFYDGTRFHRITKDFIQGGDPFSRADDVSLYGRGGPGFSFADEINTEPMTAGVLAMASAGAGTNTNGSQFFIITASSTPWLQGKHTVFARVISGLDIARKISAQSVRLKSQIPVKLISIQKISLTR